MAKKSAKPKPRTNWKQRALHCEEVINIQNVLAESREKKHAALLLRAEELRKKLCDAMDYGMELDKQVELEVKLRDEYWNRALTAEKHNALLLEEREAPCCICSTPVKPELREYYFCGINCLVKYAGTKSGELFDPGNELADKYRRGLNPTHWQRFKSWLSRRGK